MVRIALLLADGYLLLGEMLYKTHHRGTEGTEKSKDTWVEAI